MKMPSLARKAGLLYGGVRTGFVIGQDEQNTPKMLAGLASDVLLDVMI